MSKNPYRSPLPPYKAQKRDEGRPLGQMPVEKLKFIAAIQKALIIFIAGRVIGVIIALSLPIEIGPFVFIATYFIAILSTITVILLAIQVFGVVQAILYGFLSLIPCIGLIVLLQVNGEATNILQSNGIKVGLFGAKGQI